MKQINISNPDTSKEFTFYDNNNGSILRSFEGFEYSDIAVALEDVAGLKSAYFQYSKNKRRVMAFIGDFVGSDKLTNRRDILDVFASGSLKLLKFTTYDDLELQCEAELNNISNPYNNSLTTFRVELIAPDWRFYDQTLTQKSMSETEIIGGAEIPATIPMSLWSDVDLDNTVENEGNENSLPIFVISGPGNNFEIRNQTNGESLIVDESISLGETITVDVKERTVTKEGVSIKDKISGDWVVIEPGFNQFGFGVVSGSDSNTELEIKFRSAYNGI